MSNREKCNTILDSFTEEQLVSIAAVLESIRSAMQVGASPSEEPNAETQEALREVEEMKKHPDAYKGYTDIDKLFEDLLA